MSGKVSVWLKAAQPLNIKEASVKDAVDGHVNCFAPALAGSPLLKMDAFVNIDRSDCTLPVSAKVIVWLKA